MVLAGFLLSPVMGSDKKSLYTDIKKAGLTKNHVKILKKYRLLLVTPSYIPKTCKVNSVKAEKESYSIIYKCNKHRFTVMGIGVDERGDLIGFIKKYKFHNPIFGTQYLGNVDENSDENGKFSPNEPYFSERMESPKIKEDHEYTIEFSTKFPSKTAIKIAESLLYLKK